jgi:SH3-like domain-containing protein
LPRKGNSEQYEPAFVSPVPFGTPAVVLDERNGWYFLRFSNGQEGWLLESQTFRM